MSNSTKKWYVVYTKIGCEKKVANFLTRKNIENYCPFIRQWNGRKKIVLEPLFNSYVFVKIETADIWDIKMVDWVVNFVYWLGTPVVIQNEEIGIIKRFMDEYTNVKLEKIPINAGGISRMDDGSASENKTHVVSVKNDIVTIELPSLGYLMLAEVEKSTVEILTATKQSYGIVEKYNYAI